MEQMEEMFMMQIFEKLKKIMKENYSIHDVNIDDRLLEDLNINSLEMADMTYTIEEEFDIEFAGDEIYSVVTVRDLVYLINQLVDAKTQEGISC